MAFQAGSMFRSLRHRNYRLFFLGQIISLIGSWMQSVAQAWLVYRITDSAVLLGWVGFAGQIPVLLLSPVGGTIADRYDRKSIILATQAASMVLALVLAALTFAHAIQVWQILTLSVLLGVVNSFDIPARQSFLLDMVNREDLPNAIALNSSMFNGARVIGPAVAGVLVAAIGEAWCFLANGISYLAVITGLVMMRVPPRTILRVESTPLQHILEGFRFVGRTRPIRALLLLLGVISLVGMPYTVLMPVFASQILGGGASALGILMASTGVGALTGALILARKKGFQGLGRLIAFSAGGFGVSLVLFSLSRNFYLSVALLFPVGLLMMLEMASSNTLVQAMVPDHLRGRVMSVYSMMFMGMAPFGALLAGSLANVAGAPAVVAAGGVVSIVAGLLFAWILPVLRPQARELIVAQQSAAGVPQEGITGGLAR